MEGKEGDTPGRGPAQTRPQATGPPPPTGAGCRKRPPQVRPCAACARHAPRYPKVRPCETGPALQGSPEAPRETVGPQPSLLWYLEAVEEGRWGAEAPGLFRKLPTWSLVYLATISTSCPRSRGDLPFTRLRPGPAWGGGSQSEGTTSTPFLNLPLTASLWGFLCLSEENPAASSWDPWTLSPSHPVQVLQGTRPCPCGELQVSSETQAGRKAVSAQPWPGLCKRGCILPFPGVGRGREKEPHHKRLPPGPAGEAQRNCQKSVQLSGAPGHGGRLERAGGASSGSHGLPQGRGGGTYSDQGPRRIPPRPSARQRGSGWGQGCSREAGPGCERSRAMAPRRPKRWGGHRRTCRENVNDGCRPGWPSAEQRAAPARPLAQHSGGQRLLCDSSPWPS